MALAFAGATSAGLFGVTQVQTTFCRQNRARIERIRSQLEQYNRHLMQAAMAEQSFKQLADANESSREADEWYQREIGRQLEWSCQPIYRRLGSPPVPDYSDVTRRE
jgi:hypothetical protein